MDVFCSKQSIALTVIFSYLISLPNGENQAVSSQPELQKFLILNKMIYQSFNLNETFWLWYIYYVFKCDLCLADAHNLNNATEKLKLNRRNSNSKTSKTSEKSTLQAVLSTKLKFNILLACSLQVLTIGVSDDLFKILLVVLGVCKYNFCSIKANLGLIVFFNTSVDEVLDFVKLVFRNLYRLFPSSLF